MRERDLAGAYLRFCFGRAVCARGWWLATTLYLVVVADLTPFQLVFIGTAQGLLSLVSEIPAGVVADTISRKWAVVAAQAISGVAMVVTGLVTGFPALVATQMIWGLGWTFSSGADVAWLTDELGEEPGVSRVLTTSARWEQIGGFAGTVGFGLLALATSLATSMVLAGCAMTAVGVVIAVRWPEGHFVPATGNRWRASAGIFRKGIDLARRDREILVILLATVLIHGVAETARLYPKILVDLGFPGSGEPIAWLTALSLVTLAAGAVVLRIVESHIEGVAVARPLYALACLVGGAGFFVLAQAPDSVTAMAGIVLVSGITMPVTRAVGTIWVNRRVTSDVRATVQSFLAQAEYSGEIVIGFGLALAAGSLGIGPTVMLAGAVLVLAAVLVFRAAIGRIASGELVEAE